jgi:hypothetical protein
MAGWGGARPGAGRPRKNDLYRSAIREAEQKVADKLPHIADKLLELVDGVYVQSETPEGEVNVYLRPPDRQAAEYLWNRIAGKPSEHVDVDADVNVTGGDSADRLTPEQRAAVRAALFGASTAAGPGSEPGGCGDS